MTAACRFLLILLTSLAVVLAGEQVTDYKDLFPPLPPVPEAENGWLLVKKLSPKVVRPQSRELDLMIMPGEQRSGEPIGVNRSLLKEYVADNGPTIAVAREILKRQAWQRVRRSDGNPDFVFSGDGTSRIIFSCRMILAEAIVKAESGAPDEAWPDIIAVTRLGQRINQSGGPLIDTLTGSTLLVAGARAAAWAGQFAPDAATAKRMAAELRIFEDPGEAARTMDWSKHIKAVVDTYRRARLTKPSTWADYQKAHARDKDSISESGGKPVEEAVGSERFLHQVVITNTARVRLASVSLLIKAWQLGHGGELPDSLELLVPDYLTSVPLDPFDGKAMRYDKLRRKLWCVGANLKDDAATDDSETDVIQPLSK